VDRVAHPEYLRQKAVELRRTRRLTIDELADCLALPRTTIYYWVRDIEIPRSPGLAFGSPGHPAAQARAKGNRAMQAKWRKIREEEYRRGTEEFLTLCGEPTFRDFVCMYIGEGYKRSRNEVSLCNSDPAVVKLAQTWIVRLSANPVTYSIQYHADQSIDELRAFWSHRLGIRPDEVRFQRKSNSKQLTGRRWRSRYRVLKVCAADTRFRARLQAWIELVEADWG
jgi:hypothetical protein